MRILRFLIQKEFRQIFRNHTLLKLLFVMPIMQLLILPLAADYEIKNVKLSLVDHDHSTYSQQLTNKILASNYFKLVDYSDNFNQAFQQVETDKADLVLEIPANFETNLIRESEEKLFLAVNAINGVKANLGAAYLNRIIAEFNLDLRLSLVNPGRFSPIPMIEVHHLNWFNPKMNYRFFMVPGVLVLLSTVLIVFISTLNIVKEKEAGTIEQINVTPIKKYQFILGKLIPFWILGIIIFSLGLFIVAYFAYGIVPLGNLFLLYGFLATYLLAVLGIGLLISTFSETGQQAMSIAFFFMMIFALMSGLFTPIESMPDWAHFITQLSPITYFIETARMIILKGSEYQHIQYNFLITVSFALIFNTLAILNYRKTN